jgi:hypothetical protein
MRRPVVFLADRTGQDDAGVLPERLIKRRRVGITGGGRFVEDAFASSLDALARSHPALSGLAPARIPTVAWTSQKKS